MRNRYKGQNLFKTSLNSVIPAGVATDTTEKYFDIVDAIGIDAGWAYVNFQDSLERERIRFHRTSNGGTRLYYYEYWRETPAQSHTTSVYVQINNVAEYVNFLGKNVDDIGYVEQLEDVGLRVQVYGGILQHSGDTQVSVSDTILTMADDTTNYIYINYVTGTIHVSTTMPSFPLVATVVTASGDITSITDNRSLYVGGNSTGAPTTFTQLSDTPVNYSGSSRKFVRVKNDLSGLEFSNEFGDISTDSLMVTNGASFGSYITIKNLSSPDQPGTPVSGNTAMYIDEATKKIKYKEDTGDTETISTENYVNTEINNIDRSSLVDELLAGEDISVGDCLYLNYSDGKLYKTDADDIAKLPTDIVRFSKGTYTTGQTVSFDYITTKTKTGLTLGSTYFVSNTAGAIGTTPGTNYYIVGKAISTNCLLIADKSYPLGYTSNTTNHSNTGSYTSTYGTEIYFTTKKTLSITLSYNYTGGGSGQVYAGFQYSLDGVNWVTIAQIGIQYATGSGTANYVYDVNPNMYIRGYGVGQYTGGSSVLILYQ